MANRRSSNAILQNSAVLTALTTLNQNVNHSYDEAAWLKWYNSQLTTSGVDLRRDQ